MIRDDQPDAREGQAGCAGVAERPVVPMKLGNAGGGKGPQFKTDAASDEGPGDWATYQLRTVFRNCRWRYTQKRRQKPAIVSTLCTTRSAERTSLLMLMPSAAPTRARRVCRHRRHEGLDAHDVRSIRSGLFVHQQPTLLLERKRHWRVHVLGHYESQKALDPGPAIRERSCGCPLTGLGVAVGPAFRLSAALC